MTSRSFPLPGEMPARPKVKVAHIISGLFGGGAERMLFRLLAGSNRNRFEHTVFSLSDRGDLADPIEALGIDVVTLGMRFAKPNLRAFWQLRDNLGNGGFDVVQTWMYHADLIGGLAVIGKHIPVIWNIRADIVPFSKDRKTFLITRACATLSRFLPDQIICCSNTARLAHERLGYDSSRIFTIQNGFESIARMSEEEKLQVKRELGVSELAPILGMVTRDDPRKDLKTFFKAASILHREAPQVNFVLCGKGIAWDNLKLASMAEDAGVKKVCHFLGRREDVHRLMSVFDVATLTSSSEAFPNVVGEAMSCGVPVVSTAVGDAAEIIGDTGIVVPPSNAMELKEAWLKLLVLPSEDRLRLGERARRRIEESFSIRKAVDSYQKIYLEQAVSAG